MPDRRTVAGRSFRTKSIRRIIEIIAVGRYLNKHAPEVYHNNRARTPGGGREIPKMETSVFVLRIRCFRFSRFRRYDPGGCSLTKSISYDVIMAYGRAKNVSCRIRARNIIILRLRRNASRSFRTESYTVTVLCFCTPVSASIASFSNRILRFRDVSDTVAWWLLRTTHQGSGDTSAKFTYDRRLDNRSDRIYMYIHTPNHETRTINEISE